MVKTSSTMYELARKYACGKGARMIGTRFGYGLTYAEMEKRFFEEGFNTARKTWLTFINQWASYGYVIDDQENQVYWFAMNHNLEAEARKVARKLGIPVSQMVTGNELGPFKAQEVEG